MTRNGRSLFLQREPQRSISRRYKTSPAQGIRGRWHGHGSCMAAYSDAVETAPGYRSWMPHGRVVPVDIQIANDISRRFHGKTARGGQLP